MLRAEHLLVDLERPLGVGERAVEVALVLENLPDVVSTSRDVGVLRPSTFSSILSTR